MQRSWILALLCLLAAAVFLAGRGKKAPETPRPVAAPIPPDRRLAPSPQSRAPDLPTPIPATGASAASQAKKPSRWDLAAKRAYELWFHKADRALLQQSLLDALAQPLGDDPEDYAAFHQIFGMVNAAAADPGMAGFGETLWNLPGDAGKLAAIRFWGFRGELPEDRVLPYLLQAPLSAREANARRLAADALIEVLSSLPEGRIERIQASAVVMKALPEMVPGRRGVALLWAVPHAGEQAIPVLRTMLQDPEARELARLSVGSLPREWAGEFLPELRKTMEAGSPYSALALAELGEKDAVPFLRKADFPGDPSLRMASASALAALGDDSGREELASWLERPEWMEGKDGEKVLLGLARLKDERARPGLEAIAKSEDPARREAGEKGLKILGPTP